MRKTILLILSFISIATTLYSQGPGCPNIDAGPDQTLACNVTCTTLNATFFQTGATNSYVVSSIPYNPPAPSSAWTNTFVNTDDVWSGVINLPFTFCYYGTAYTQLVVGANGVISFNTGYANQFCPWSYSASVPSATLPLNAIFGAYHDIDPSVCGNIRYAISGTFPCRTFMFDFNAVCQYSCTSLKTTQRIVLYETSNAIEVYIGNKPTCTGWNGGRAVIGIQNGAGSQGVVAPGRQTGAWTASNEGWRFTPNGTPNYQINWYSSAAPGVIGTGPSVSVCPTANPTTYSAILTYTNCNNSTVTVSDYVQVNLTGPAPPPIFNNTPCAGQTLALTTNPVTNATYIWSGPGGWTATGQSPTRPGSTTAMSGTYTLYVVVAGCTSSITSKNIAILGSGTVPTFTVNTPICSGNTLNFDAPTYPGATYVWSGPGGWTSNVEDPVRTGVTTGGTYSLYIAAGGCTSTTASQNVTVNALPAAPAISTNSPVCTGTSINLTGPSVSGATYVWSGPGGFSSNLQSPSIPNANTAMSGTYSLYVVVAGCTSNTSTAAVTVNGPPIPYVDMPQEVCEGTTVTLLSGTYPGATYVWSGPNGFSSNAASPTITNVAAAGAGTYNLYLVQSGCTSLTASSYMNVISTPTPTVSSNSPICQGATLNLTASTVTGGSYVWSGPNGFTSTVQNPTITGATPAASGTYSVYVVANGCTSTTSTVSVIVNPTPTVNSVTSQTICNGTPSTAVTFSGAVAGTTFNWTNSNTSIGLGGSGTNTIPAFTGTNTGFSPVTGTITVTPTASGCPGPTGTFSYTVNPTPTVTTIPNQTLCSGAGSAAVTPTGPVAGTTFTWTNNTPSIGLAASGNNSIPTFTATNTGTTPITATISVTPTANGCVGTPSTFTITVNPAPDVNTIPNQTICRGATTTLVVPSGSVTGTTYTWTNSNSSIGLPSSGNDNIPSFTGTNTTNAPITGTITVTPNANSCTGTPTTFTITVNPRPTVNAITTQSFCPGIVTPIIPVTGPVTGTTFTWTNSNTNIGLAASGNGDIPSFTAANPGTGSISSTVVVTPTANGCVGTTSAFFINISPSPNVNTIPNQTVCNGANTTAVNPSGSVGGTSYTWTNNNTSIGLAASGNGPIPSFTGVNTGTAPVTATITVTPGTASCVGTPTTFTITVNPTPTVNAVANQTACNGALTTAVNFTGPVTGTQFNWANSNSAIGLAASGSGNIAPFTATNSTNAPITSTITVTPVASSCTGTPSSFTVTVNPTPTVNTVSNQTVCNGAATTAVTFTGGVSGTTFDWANNNTATGLSGTGIGNIASFTATNTGTTAITSTVTVTPSANGCTGTPTTFDIHVNPTPTVNAVANQTLCNGATTTAISFTSAVTGTTFNWTNNNTNTGLAANGIGNIAAFAATNTGTAPITSTVTVTPTANGCTGTPVTFDITVNPTPSVDNITNQTLCNGAATTAVNFTGPVTGTTFDWANNNTATGLGATGVGNIPTFTATNTGTTAITSTISVTPTANGCSGPAKTFTITVNPTATAATIPNQTVCNGASTTAVSFTGSVGGSTFAWTNDNTSIGLAANGLGDIAAFTVTNTGTSAVVATITVTPTANSCSGTPSTFTITVNPTPTVNPVANQTLCNGATTTAVNFSGNVTGTTFNWANNNTNTGLAASGVGNIATFTAINAGTTPITSTVTVTPIANSCTGTATTFDINVNPTPTVNAVTNQTLCNGASTTAISFSGAVNNTSYSWTNSNTAIGLAASGIGDISSFIATNTGTAPISATVTVTPSANSCTGTPTTFTIAVNPTPTVNNVANQTVCNGAATTTVTFTGPVAGTTYDWANSNVNIGLAGSGIGNSIPSFTGTNTGNSAITGTITVTPTANSCVGTVNSFDITVNPTPTVSPVTSQTVCRGASSTAVSFAGNVTGTTFNWTNTNTATGLAANGIGDIASFTTTNTGTTPITSTVTVTPTASSCTGTATTFTITVNPTHTGTPVAASICDGDTYTFGGQSFTTSGSYPVVFQNIYGCDSTVTLNLTVIPAMGPPPTNDYFNTANNGAGGVLPGGSADAHWTVATGNINGPYIPARVMSSIPGNYYNSPWPDCGWISHSATGSHTVNTEFFYKIEFDLACANQCGQSYTDPNVFCLNLDFFADNSVYEIYVNGVPQSAQLGNMPVANPYYATGFSSTGMVSVSFCDGWQPGTNTVIVEVVSGPGYAGFLGQTSINPPPPASDTITASICDNQTYSFGTQTLTTAGTYTETFSSVLGCDSVMTVILSVYPTYTGTQNATICNGDSYTFGGQSYTTAGSYPVTFPTIHNCDSVVTLNLTVNPTYTSTVQQTICQGNSVTFGGNTYNTSGNYPITFQTVNGCDSTVTLQLTVTPNPAVTINPQTDQCLNGNSFNFSLAQTYGPTASFGWTFTGGNPASSTLQAPTGISYATAGQYTVNVTVTENNCQSQGTLTVNVLPQPNAQFNALPPSGCAPLTVNFTNITVGGGNVSWSFPGGNPATSTTSPVSVLYNTAGQYGVTLTVTFANGCSDTETVPNLINVQNPPIAGFTIQPLEVDMANPTASFIDGSTGGSSIYYFVGHDGSGTPGPDAQYHFTAEGQYDVMQVVNSTGGCTDTAYGHLVVSGSTEVFIPNAFTPNADPTNPGFGIVGNGFTDFHMMIFNRWGELLFESLDANMKWAGTNMGKPVPLDVYVYKVELRNYKKVLKTYIGNVTLIR